ncbi:MAG TPA: AarF/UbiB family protein [Candidatus Paceibacterota bacterium]
MRFFRIAKNGISIFRQIRQAESKKVSYKVAGPKINKLLSDLGPTFIKLGQMLSLRADLINPDLADELRELLDHGSTVDESDVNNLFISELGKAPDEIFEKFTREPFAVASLSQVHLAHLKGQILAVKVQKPGIKALIHQDLTLVRQFLGIAQIFAFSKYDRSILRILKVSVDEFFKWIEHELDYRLEALNIIRIKNNLSEIKSFQAPEVLHALSTKLILTTEYIDGISLNTLINFVPDLAHLEEIKYQNIKFSKKTFIKEFLEIVFKQVFEDGYFHADPHPANILMTPKNKIAFIDFGVVGVLQPHIKEILVKVLSGVIERDVKKTSQSLVELNEIEGKIEITLIERRVRTLLDDWQTGSAIEMTMAEVFYRLLIIAQESKIEVPLSVFILGKTVLEYDGLLRKFDPEMDILNSLKSHMERGSMLDIKNIPVAIKELLAYPENLPEGVFKFAKQLANEGVEFVSHLIRPDSLKK